MLTVKDLFEIKAIDGLKIVAGDKGIDNIISFGNIMENPDTFNWLSPNELLLSTGYIFKDNEELPNQIIKELSKKLFRIGYQDATLLLTITTEHD